MLVLLTNLTGTSDLTLPPLRRALDASVCPGSSNARRLARDETHRRAIRGAAVPLLADIRHGLTGKRLAATSGRSGRTVRRLYPSADDLCGDVLTDHIRGLTEALSGAFDVSKTASPSDQLESITKAWMDFVAVEPDQHRAFLFYEPSLSEPYRSQVQTNYRQALDIVRGVLCAVVPGLSDLAESILGPATAVLSSAAMQSSASGPETRRQEARRVSRMLIGVGTEISGGWNRLLPVPPKGKPRRF